MLKLVLLAVDQVVPGDIVLPLWVLLSAFAALGATIAMLFAALIKSWQDRAALAEKIALESKNDAVEGAKLDRDVVNGLAKLAGEFQGLHARLDRIESGIAK